MQGSLKDSSVAERLISSDLRADADAWVAARGAGASKPAGARRRTATGLGRPKS